MILDADLATFPVATSVTAGSAKRLSAQHNYGLHCGTIVSPTYIDSNAHILQLYQFGHMCIHSDGDRLESRVPCAKIEIEKLSAHFIE